MLGHRTLNLDDYLFILKRRLWLILLPAVIVPILAYAYSYTIPSQFVSQTLVLIDQQKVPGEYVAPIVTSDLDSRLASMREQIVSRSRIEPIISRYNLFGNQHMTMDERIEQTRKNINIQPIHSQIAHSGGLPGFYIAFTANDAKTAQLVCGEITSLFLSQSLQAREDAAEGTTEFLKSQLAEAKQKLDDQDKKLADFQRQYVGKLPTDENNSMQMLSTLNTQVEAVTQNLTHMEEQKSYYQTMIAQQTASLPGAGQSAGNAAQSLQPSGPTPVQEAQLLSLENQEADLSARYTADYPDVIAVRRKIAELRKEIAQGSSPKSAGTSASSSQHISEPPVVQQLRNNIRALDMAITDAKRQQASIQNAVKIYQDRISSSPQVQEEYKQLTRDYSTAQAFYDDLLGRLNKANEAKELEVRQEGEQFRVLDPPNLPDAPNYPKRPIFAFGGLAAGLMLGLVIVGVLEYRDTALRTERDVWAFTKLPTLAVIALNAENNQPRSLPRSLLRLKPAAK